MKNLNNKCIRLFKDDGCINTRDYFLRDVYYKLHNFATIIEDPYLQSDAESTTYYNRPHPNPFKKKYLHAKQKTKKDEQD